MADPNELQVQMDVADLYREDVFTDAKVGTIRQLTPVKSDGALDPSRPVRFAGQTQILTTAGMLPLNFDIDAASLAEAVQKFGTATKTALEDTMHELQEMRRQAASQLVIPDAGTTSSILGPSGLPPRPGGKPRLS